MLSVGMEPRSFRLSQPMRGSLMRVSVPWIDPVSLKLPMPFLRDLNLGKPGFSPFFTRRKKFWQALSQSRSASWGMHVE